MIFTDWTATDPKYFYIRGVVYGMIAATLFWKWFLPIMQRIKKKSVRCTLGYHHFQSTTFPDWVHTTCNFKCTRCGKSVRTAEEAL